MATEQAQKEAFNVYCNESSITMSYYDFRLNFSENTADDANILGSIAMSPQHAKALLHILAENVKKYEEIFGEIKPFNNAALSKLQDAGIFKQSGVKNE